MKKLFFFVLFFCLIELKEEKLCYKYIMHWTRVTNLQYVNKTLNIPLINKLTFAIVGKQLQYKRNKTLREVILENSPILGWKQ